MSRTPRRSGSAGAAWLRFELAPAGWRRLAGERGGWLPGQCGDESNGFHRVLFVAGFRGAGLCSHGLGRRQVDGEIA